jgi:hypothetical protein
VAIQIQNTTTTTTKKSKKKTKTLNETSTKTSKKSKTKSKNNETSTANDELNTTEAVALKSTKKLKKKKTKPNATIVETEKTQIDDTILDEDMVKLNEDIYNDINVLTSKKSAVKKTKHKKRSHNQTTTEQTVEIDQSAIKKRKSKKLKKKSLSTTTTTRKSKTGDKRKKTKKTNINDLTTVGSICATNQVHNEDRIGSLSSVLDPCLASSSICVANDQVKSKISSIPLDTLAEVKNEDIIKLKKTVGRPMTRRAAAAAAVAAVVAPTPFKQIKIEPFVDIKVEPTLQPPKSNGKVKQLIEMAEARLKTPQTITKTGIAATKTPSTILHSTARKNLFATNHIVQFSQTKNKVKLKVPKEN